MAGHSRPKNGVASLAYARLSTSFLHSAHEDVDARHSPGMTRKKCSLRSGHFTAMC
jgi:hypothetical protein